MLGHYLLGKHHTEDLGQGQRLDGKRGASASTRALASPMLINWTDNKHSSGAVSADHDLHSAYKPFGVSGR